MEKTQRKNERKFMPVLVLLPIIVILNYALAWHATGGLRIGNVLAGTTCLLVWLWYAGEMFLMDF